MTVTVTNAAELEVQRCHKTQDKDNKTDFLNNIK